MCESKMRQRISLLICASIVALGVFLSGCPAPDQDDSQYGELVKSEKARETSPVVDPADLTGLAQGNSEFAIDLYQSVRSQDGNLFYSPYSISLALAMTYAGARNQTEQQMADTLHFTLSQEQLHPAFNALDLELASRGEGAAGQDDEGFRLNIANAIWGQSGYPFLMEFLDVLAVNYGAGLRLLDFMSDPDGSRVTINDWVAEQTEEKIQDLIPEGAVDTLTRLVLTNAVYFNAAWASPFEEEDTRDDAFHLLDGTEITVPMMSQTEHLPYTEGDGYQAVELPYDGQELSMVILLPDAGQFDEYEDSFDIEQLDTIVDNLSTSKVALTMPKFTYESEFSLAQTLDTMGMPDAFSASADFSGIDGVPGRLVITDVIHKAFVLVDESGTEAAAATAVIVGATSAPNGQDVIEVTVDRPFIFLIRDIQTRMILFIGRVLDPT